MSDLPEKTIKPLPPQAAPPAVMRSGKAVRRPAASQVVSLPVVLISAAVVLAVAATILVARHGSKRSASKLAVPTAQVQASAGPAGAKPAMMAEVPAEVPVTEVAPAIEGARNTAADPTPTGEDRSEELGVEGPAEEGPMLDGMGQAGPAEYGEQGRSTGYARRRW